MPLKVLVALVGVVIAAPAPDTIDHDPVPLAGAFADSATDVPQTLRSIPACAVVIGLVSDIVTSSELGLQIPFVVVHRRVYVTFAFPVKLEAGLDGVPMVPPAPVTTDHVPVPIAGVLAASAVDVLQTIWSVPALATVGGAIRVTVTSSEDEAQGVLAIVQRKVYVVPAEPVKELVAEFALANDPPVPETMVHVPVPDVGTFPVIGRVVPQKLLSVPALAVVGAPFSIIKTSSLVGAQPAFESVQRRVYAVPGFPVNVDVADADAPMDPPVPDTIVHAPVPAPGLFAASVVDVAQTF